MDLGIKGRKALVCASSQGLGYACATALAREGAIVTINGRDRAKLADASAAIAAATGGELRWIAADLTDASARGELIAACGESDILITNNAGPPPGLFETWDEAAWLGAVNANMLPALMLIRGLLPGMRARKFGRIVNITSAMVKTPLAPMGLSTAARAALTAACKALVPEIAADNVTINNLLPERFDTPRQEKMAQLAVALKGITYEEARAEIADSIAAKRFGRPEEFGDACAFLCAAQAGFISGQNLQLDGGSYRGLI
ncbi:MAG: SDR family oxidoreductase [Alphaproteobacteria bacterium]|nr:SDR family oxidoreductase [Alphaproteobacteria bacterium]